MLLAWVHRVGQHNFLSFSHPIRAIVLQAAKQEFKYKSHLFSFFLFTFLSKYEIYLWTKERDSMQGLIHQQITIDQNQVGDYFS